MSSSSGSSSGSGSSAGFQTARATAEASTIPISQSFNLNILLPLPPWTGPAEFSAISHRYQDHCATILSLIHKGEFTKINTEVFPFLSLSLFFFLTCQMLTPLFLFLLLFLLRAAVLIADEVLDCFYGDRSVRPGGS